VSNPPDQCTSGEFEETIGRRKPRRTTGGDHAAENRDVSRNAFTRYVALGDSLTEGLCDAAPGRPEAWLGWADRLAGILDGDARLSGTSVEFANLAVRGRRIQDVVDAQIPAALQLQPDLVSVLVGGNDLMSPAADPDALAARLEVGVRRLRGSGATVLLANLFDPRFAFFLKPFRGRAAVFNANIWSIARDQQAVVLDLWGVREFRDPAMWASDRVHLSSRGHRLLASHAAHALGVPYAEVSGVEAAEVAPRAGEARGEAPPDSLPFRTWLRMHAIPWVGRRLRHISTGDGRGPKLPVPQSVELLHGGIVGAVGGQH
jgi:lysophospholipase L1-like esterase